MYSHYLSVLSYFTTAEWKGNTNCHSFMPWSDHGNWPSLASRILWWGGDFLLKNNIYKGNALSDVSEEWIPSNAKEVTTANRLYYNWRIGTRNSVDKGVAQLVPLSLMSTPSCSKIDWTTIDWFPDFLSWTITLPYWTMKHVENHCFCAGKLSK